MNSINPWTHKAAIIAPNIGIQDPKYGTPNHQKDSTNPRPVFLELEPTIHNTTIYRIRENTFYPSIKVKESEDLLIRLETHLSISLAKKFQVFHFLYLGPGPASYRKPSDFGHYDDIIHKSGQSFFKWFIINVSFSSCFYYFELYNMLVDFI